MKNYPKTEIKVQSMELFNNFMQKRTYSQKKIYLKIKIKSWTKLLLGIKK